MNLSNIPTVVNNYGEIILEDKIGFSSIPNQIRNKGIHEGFIFNLLVVGRRGLGTKTLVNSLFGSPILSAERSNDINTSISEIIENGIKLKARITTFHNSNYDKLYEHISRLNSEYFEEEQLIFNKITDKRIHCCLFLIPNDSILENEVECLRKLATRTNVVPVITKADTYTCEELENYKRQINAKIFENGRANEMNISVCDQPSLFSPIMSVIASEDVFDIDGVPRRGRQYPWGFVPIAEYCDFKTLQQLIIYEKFEDLQERTNEIFYSDYRKKNIKNISDERFFKKLQSQIEGIVHEKYLAKKEQLLQEERELDKFFHKQELKSIEE